MQDDSGVVSAGDVTVTVSVVVGAIAVVALVAALALVWVAPLFVVYHPPPPDPVFTSFSQGQEKTGTLHTGKSLDSTSKLQMSRF